MEKLVLTYVGKDSWERPVYKNEDNGVLRLFKDVDPRPKEQPEITTCSSFEGEPDTPIAYIKKYEGVELEFIPKRVTW